MNAELEYILSSTLGQGVRQGKEILYSCPFCNHRKKKLSINIATNKWKCWVCGARGGKLLSLVRKLDVSYQQIKQLSVLLADEVPHVHVDEVEATLTLPPEYAPLWISQPTRLFREAVTYVRSRGLTLADAMRYRIGYCEEGQYEGRIIVPSYDADGRLNYFVGRAISKYKLNYMNPHVSKNVIGFENFIHWKQPIILCEGVFDAMAIKRNAIPLLGKTVSKKLQAKIIGEGVTDIYLALDEDALKQTLIIAEKFMRENINVYLVEMAGKDPSEMGFTKTRHQINSARKLTFADLISLRLSRI